MTFHPPCPLAFLCLSKGADTLEYLPHPKVQFRGKDSWGTAVTQVEEAFRSK